MTSIWFIRHGESESNAGLPSASAASPSLTERGRLQASHIAQFIPRKPDLVVYSSYRRAQQSAQPLLERFSSIPVETWPVHEFTYLSSQHYLDATVSDRRSAANRYWLKSDPEYLDGPEAESFNQMILRVKQTLENINKSNKNFVLIYSHGWFIRGLLWYLITREKINTGQSATLNSLRELKRIGYLPYLYLNHSIKFSREKGKMWHYLFFSGTMHMPNASILQFDLDKDQEMVFRGFTTEHLPRELIGYKSLDK